MRYISLFSGIEAASVAWEPLGWKPVAFSEIDPFCCALLKERWPDVPNLGDITEVDWTGYEGEIDVVIGGSPCQSFSTAGRREGLRGESGLMWEYIRTVREIRPRIFVWENVPGALTSEGGAAFGQLLSEMDEVGYGLAWRVLDAQFFGLAQRRERVFLVGVLGEWGGAGKACEVLFEQDALRWDTPTSKDKRAQLAADAAGGAAGGDGAGGGGDPASLPFGFAQNTRNDLRIVGDGTVSGALSTSPGDEPDDLRVPGRLGGQGGGCGLRVPCEREDAEHRLRGGAGPDAHSGQAASGGASDMTGGGCMHAGEHDRQGAGERAARERDERVPGVHAHGEGQARSGLQGGLDVLVFNQTQVTSPRNGNNPKWGDPCHTISATDRPPVAIIRKRK